MARAQHAATLLSDGRVLITGAGSNSSTLAELYDPTAGTFGSTGSLLYPHDDSTATLLADGRVLVVGGPGNLLAEVYDPATGKFTYSSNGGATKDFRFSHTATLLPDGRVLIVGGSSRSEWGPGEVLASAELYDPNKGTFELTGSMSVARNLHTATLLPDGRVLITGGENALTPSLSSAEIYDPTTGTFAATGSMVTARTAGTATLLPSGAVFIAGGASGSSGLDVVASVELYDSQTGQFRAAGSMTEPRFAHAATLLPDSRLLITGGYSLRGQAGRELATAELCRL